MDLNNDIFYQFKTSHGQNRLKTSLFYSLQVSHVNNLYLFFSSWSFGILLWEIATFGKYLQMVKKNEINYFFQEYLIIYEASLNRIP